MFSTGWAPPTVTPSPQSNLVTSASVATGTDSQSIFKAAVRDLHDKSQSLFFFIILLPMPSALLKTSA